MKNTGKKLNKATKRLPGSKKAAPHENEDSARYYYKGNRQKQLRAFVYTVKLGTLTRAAEALYLSQPTVSLQLQALERELGAHLLERSRRRINLTDAGDMQIKRGEAVPPSLATVASIRGLTKFHAP